MASLAFGAAGGFLFGPLGFLIGSAIGNLLFPQKQEGPRLTDLHTTTSAYGEMIPRVYGKYRVPLKVTWADQLQEHKHKSGGKGGARLGSSPYGIRRAVDEGGKGGPNVTTYTYTCSFYGHLCEGPIVSVLKLWFDKQLVWSVDAEESPDIPFTVFTGDSTQMPFSAAETVLGAGNVSAHRGKAGLGLDTLELGDYGNRIPNIEAEVLVSGGAIPWTVSTFNPIPDGPIVGGQMCGEYDGEVITASFYSASGSVTYYERYFMLDGTPTGSPPSMSIGIGHQLEGTVGNKPLAMIWDNTSGGHLQWFNRGIAGASVTINPAGGSNLAVAFVGHGIWKDDYVYGCSHNSDTNTTGISRWPAPDGVPAATADAFYNLGGVAASDVAFATGDSDSIWVTIPPASSSIGPAMYEFDADLNVLQTWCNASETPPPPHTPGEFNTSTHNFVIYHGMFAGYSHTGTGDNVTAVRINSDQTFTQVGQIPQSLGPNIRLHAGLCLCSDGVISLDPPESTVTLGDIVAAESDLCDQPNYDVTSLTDIVPGYAISSQGTGIASISTLQNAWPFDAVESSPGLMKFVRRGQASIVTIPYTDLAARQDGQEPPTALEPIRKLETDLPRTVYVKYANVDADYQDGSQYERRLVTNATSDITIEMAIAMSDSYGKTVAAVYLFGAWFARTSFKFYTSVKYAYLEPTDVVTIGMYTMRLTKKTEHAGGVIEWDAVQDDPALWIRSNAGASGVGNTSPPIVGKVLSQLQMLDLPLLNDDDSPNGPYAASAPVSATTAWSTHLYRSLDGGTTYDEVDGTATADIIGTCSNALGDWAGGYVFDESNSLTVLIGDAGGTLSSVTRDEAMAGAFRILAGNEIIYARDATLTAPLTYQISGLIRGQRGTEWATGTHSIGERFIVMPPTMNPPMPYAELGFAEKFKAVTRGMTVASATAVDFTNRGIALKPYAPVLLGGGPDTSNNQVANWTRRTRIGASEFGSAPLSESEEKYETEYWDSTYTVCARTIESTTETSSYSSADQVADFGARQSQYYVSVGQVGSYGIGTRVRATIIGSGSVINDPIVSVTPYDGVPSLPPPPPPSGGTPPINHTFTTDEEIHISQTAGVTYIYKFTTTVAHNGRYSCSEYGGIPAFRHGFISTDGTAGGKVAGTDSYGTTVGSYFTSLAPSTIYYIVIDFKWPDGSWTETPGTVCPSLVLFQQV